MKQREIKFRAWSKSREEWVDVDAHYSFDTEGKLYQTDFKQIVLMEFTGLKDKNGKEIYEGDIVRGIMPDTEQDESFEKMIIEYQGDSFVVARPNHLYFGSLESCVCNNCIEVIGNVWENGDLLK